MRIATRAAAFVMTIVALSAPGTVLSNTGPNLRSDEYLIRHLEQRWLEAEDDPVGLESILADDFIHVLPNGFVTKHQQLDYMRKRPPVPSQARHFEDLRVRVYGDVGIANGIVAAEMPRGSMKRTVFTDVFVRREGKWRAVNAQENPVPWP